MRVGIDVLAWRGRNGERSEGSRLCGISGTPLATDSRPCFAVLDGQRGAAVRSVCPGLVAVAVALIYAVCVPEFKKLCEPPSVRSSAFGFLALPVRASIDSHVGYEADVRRICGFMKIA